MIVDNNEKNLEDNNIYENLISYFNPVSFTDIIFEFENPEFMKTRNLQLKNLIYYIENKLRSDILTPKQLNFPFNNFKINESFITYQRQILFRKIFCQIYEKYVTINIIKIIKKNIEFRSN